MRSIILPHPLAGGLIRPLVVQVVQLCFELICIFYIVRAIVRTLELSIYPMLSSQPGPCPGPGILSTNGAIVQCFVADAVQEPAIPLFCSPSVDRYNIVRGTVG